MTEVVDHFRTMAVSTSTIEGMVVDTYAAPGLVSVVPVKFGDARGFLSETYSRRRFAACGIDVDFVQDNHSYSAAVGTIRGLHFQLPPHAQGKLVRVVRGAILDVVVDIRHGSPAFGKPIAVELSAANWRQLYVPPGFAHGFCTLEPDSELLYRTTDYYAPEADRGIAFDDLDLGVEWPVAVAEATLSDKDRRHPRLRDLAKIFEYGSTP